MVILTNVSMDHAQAQATSAQSSVDQDIALLRKDIRSDKKQIIGIEESVAQLRLKYVPIVNKVISGKKTALFFQLDRRLTALIDLQVASEVPLVEP